jgi:hypothetical protein
MRCVALRVVYADGLRLPGEEFILPRALALGLRKAGHVRISEEADGTGTGVEVHSG